MIFIYHIHDEFLPYQPLTVVYWTTMVTTGNGGLGSDSGEGAWEMATTSKEGSRRVNYPIPTRRGSDNIYHIPNKVRV